MRTKRSTPCSIAASATIARAEDVVVDRLERVRLHQRHVLVRGRVEDDRRAGSARRPGRSRLRLRTSASTGTQALKPRSSTSSRSMSKSALSAWSTSTIRCRLGAGELAAELGADRAAGAGDEHGLALRRRRRSRRGRPRPARGRAGPPPGPAGSGRARSRSPAISSCSPGSVFTGTPSARAISTIRGALLARGGRDRDQQLVRPAVAQQVRQLVGRAEHADAVQAQVLLARVVVDRGRSACSRARACAASPSASAGRRRRRRRRSPPCRARRSSGSAGAR